MNKIIIASIVLLSIMGCNAQKETKNSTAEVVSLEKAEENILYLVEGERKFLKEFEMSIGLKNISEDSRCPEGTTCVWEGAAVANIEVMGIATRPYTIRLSTTNNSARGYSKTAEFNGYIITLKSVNPSPTVKEGDKSTTNKYKIGITITKDSENSNTTKK